MTSWLADHCSICPSMWWTASLALYLSIDLSDSIRLFIYKSTDKPIDLSIYLSVFRISKLSFHTEAGEVGGSQVVLCAKQKDSLRRIRCGRFEKEWTELSKRVPARADTFCGVVDCMIVQPLVWFWMLKYSFVGLCAHGHEDECHCMIVQDCADVRSRTMVWVLVWAWVWARVWVWAWVWEWDWMVWYCTVWYGMVRYGKVWYGMDKRC